MADLHLAGLGLLSNRDGDREDAILVGGRDMVPIETLPQEQLADKLALDSLGDLELVSFDGASSASPERSGRPFDCKLDRAEIYTRKVEKDLELVPRR